MKTLTALEWKRFYADERRELGDAAIDKLLADAPSLELHGGLIFPHTRLRATGLMTARAAKAVVESGAERVLALGVLHGGREQDAELVLRAKAGDEAALDLARRVHGPSAPKDGGLWTEEFSLDNFTYFVHRAAALNGKRPPEIVQRYPFLTGADPLSLPGMDELFELVRQGVPVIATADMIHHGVGYGTASEEALGERDAETTAIARSWMEEGLEALAQKDYTRFLENAERVKSDFRHSGPVLRAVFGDLDWRLFDLQLVDYSDVLNASAPTWVASAMIELVPNSSHTNFATD
jgi:predicted class III extradiol MEMO1 family dioxygenase